MIHKPSTPIYMIKTKKREICYLHDILFARDIPTFQNKEAKETALPPTAPLLLTGKLLKSILQDLQSLGESLILNSKWWDESEGVSTSGDDQQSPFSGLSNDWGRINVELETLDQAPSTNTGSEAWELLLDGLETGTEQVTLGTDGLQKLLVAQAREDIVSEAGSKWVSTKGGSVVSDCHSLGDLLSNHSGSDWESVSESLGHGNDIGMGVWTSGLMGPEVTGTAETALNLIVDEEGSNLSATSTEGLEELGASRVDSSLTLNWLDNDTAGLLGNEVLQLVDLVQVSNLESWNHWAEWLLIFWSRGSRERTHCSSVERVVERNNFNLSSILSTTNLSELSSKLDGSLVRLTARVADENTASTLHSTRLKRLLNQDLAQLSSPGVVVKVGAVDELLALVVHNSDKSFITVAEGVDGNTGSQVDIFPVLQIPQLCVLSLGEDGRGARVGWDHAWEVSGGEGGRGGISGWIGAWELCFSLLTG